MNSLSCHLGAALHNLRRRELPVLPTTSDFDIPKIFGQIINGQPFILADRVSRLDRSKRMILFGTEQQLKFLFNCSHILIDGTFKSCPKVFTQVCTVHGMKYGQSMYVSFHILNYVFVLQAFCVLLL